MQSFCARLTDLFGGVALNAFGEMLPQLHVLGGITFIYSELTKTQRGTFDGKDAVGTPEWAVNFGAEGDPLWIPDLTLIARLIHTGSAFVSSDNRQEIPSYERYDIGARYTKPIGGQLFIIRATVENLLDEDYYTSFPDSLGFLYLDAPRRFLLLM